MIFITATVNSDSYHRAFPLINLPGQLQASSTASMALGIVADENREPFVALKEEQPMSLGSSWRTAM
jgi:hypothetical protein